MIEMTAFRRQGNGSEAAARFASDTEAAFQALRDDVAGLARSVADLTTRQVSETVAGVQAVAARQAEDVQARIRSKPAQSVLIAAGIGFVVSLLLAR